MARQAIGLLGDEARLQHMGQEARIAARGHFCATKIIPQYEKHYREVLERASE